MSIYTVQIEATDDGQIWYALGDPETDQGENARKAAEGTDTGGDPAYVHHLTRHDGVDTSI